MKPGRGCPAGLEYWGQRLVFGGGFFYGRQGPGRRRENGIVTIMMKGAVAVKVEERIRELCGVEVPEPAPPAGLFAAAVRTGNLVYVSGQTPRRDGKRVYTGVVGRDLTVEEGQEATRLAMLGCLAYLKGFLGDLDRVRQVVQVVGYVRSAEGFGDQPLVMNGASQLLLDAFGERGAHTRLALGTSELPGGAAVEVTCVVEVE